MLERSAADVGQTKVLMTVNTNMWLKQVKI